MNLKQQLIVGDDFVHIFKRPDGTTFEVSTTKQDYDQLAKKNPVNPTSPDGVWVQSMAKTKFDTPSGKLESGTYVDLGADILISHDGVKLTAIPKSAFTNGSITLL